jgi:uncharacterized membrane protein
VTLESKARLSGQITRLSFIGLLLFYTARFLWLAPASSANPWVIWLVYLIPLIGFTPSVLSGKPRPHAWLCFVLLIYFLGAVVTATQPNLALYGWLEVLLLVILFNGAMLFARWQSQWLRAVAATQQSGA